MNKWKKPSKNEDNAKKGEYVSVWVSGPDFEFVDRFWRNDRSEDVKRLALEFFLDKKGVESLVVWKFRLDLPNGAVVLVRHADAVAANHLHLQKFDNNSHATF